MKIDLLSKISLNKVIIILFVILAGTFLLFNEKGILNYLKLKSKVENVDEKIKDIEIKGEQKAKVIDSLQYNDKKIEEVARKKFRMKRKGEKLIEIEEK